MNQPYIYNGIKTHYDIYTDGRVYSNLTKRFLKPYKNHGGYMNVDLYINGNRIKKGLHQLVAETFIPNPENKTTVNHENGIKTDNTVENLTWATPHEQNVHAVNNNLVKHASGSKCHFAKTNEDTILQVCEFLSKGYCPLDIAYKLNIPVKTVYSVRNRETWKDISKNYVFPTSRRIRNMTVSLKDRDNIEMLLMNGDNVKEICNILNLPYENKYIRKLIYDMKYNLNKAQRLANDDSYYFIVINA